MNAEEKREVISRTFGIGRAEYPVYSEVDADVIRQFLRSMKRQGELGFWESTTYAETNA